MGRIAQTPRPITRRRFLGAAAGLIALPAAPALARPRPWITGGVASGDVGDGTAVIWSRCDRPARMLVEIATSESFRDARTVRGADAVAATDFTARAAVAGLPPGQTVFYRVRFEDLDRPGATSPPETGRLRTPSAAGASFVFGGDQCGAGWGINPDWGGLRMFETMRRTGPDLLIHLGDRIYADTPMEESVPLDDGTVWRNIVTPAKAKVAETLDEYRGNYRYNLLDHHFRRFAAEVPTLFTWDDHEVHNDWWPGGKTSKRKGFTERSVDVLAARARRAFFEYTPLAAAAAAQGRIWRSVRYGPLLEVFLLDERSHRGPNGANLEPRAGPETAMLGAAQTAWLKAALARSQALWKVVATPLPLAIAGKKKKKKLDKWANRDGGPPRGRELELAGILRFIAARGIANVVWVAADVHYAAAHRFHPDRAQFTDFRPFREFVAGPFHTRPGRPKPLDATFGPEAVFVAPKERPGGNRPPSDGYLYFGHARIDGASGTLTVSLRDVDGRILYDETLAPER